MDLSVITVSWNSKKFIGEQIESVKKGGAAAFEEIIVDNDSSDGTADFIAARFPEVKLIRPGRNLGFAAANNLAAGEAKGEYLLFLNPDMRVLPGSLTTMVDWMRRHPDAGLASCKLLDEHGKINADAAPRRFPGLSDQLALILKMPHLFPSVLNRYLFRDFNPEVEQEADSIRGSFMLMPRAIYQKLGFAFDPRYFIWFEDVDLCREVRRLGFKVYYTPAISCVDYVGQSFKRRDSLWKQRQFTKSMLIYFKKWEPGWKYCILLLARPFGITLSFVYDFFSNFKIRITNIK